MKRQDTNLSYIHESGHIYSSMKLGDSGQLVKQLVKQPVKQLVTAASDSS